MKVQKDAIGKEIKKIYAKADLIKVCPVELRDNGLNRTNSNMAIREYNYGPLNPDQPSTDFWKAKARVWDSSVEEAKSSRCCNCAAFVQTPAMIACLVESLETMDEDELTEKPGEEAAEEGTAEFDARTKIVQNADLGYCQLFHFRAMGERTCNAWLVGGPIT